MDENELKKFKYRQLQKMAMRYGIKATLPKNAMITKLNAVREIGEIPNREENEEISKKRKRSRIFSRKRRKISNGNENEEISKEPRKRRKISIKSAPKSTRKNLNVCRNRITSVIQDENEVISKMTLRKRRKSCDKTVPKSPKSPRSPKSPKSPKSIGVKSAPKTTRKNSNLVEKEEISKMTLRKRRNICNETAPKSQKSYQLTIIDKFMFIPGLQHIGEKIFLHLDRRSFLNCMIGMVSHKMTFITIFGHKYFKCKFYYI